MLIERIEPITSQSIVARCPSCQHDARFEYAGEQHWPRRIAEAAGLPLVVHLWHCEHCHSTISDTELDA